MYVLITGASSGLGKSLASIFAKENCNLVLVARRFELLENLKIDLSKYNVDIKVITADLSNEEEVYTLFNKISDLKIDIIINNAGFGNLGYFTNTDLDVELKMIDLNIKAIQIITKLYISNNEEGVVVNISSLAGYLPTPIHATYSATKSYISYFSRALDYELKKQKRNMRVLTVAPGPIKTEFNKIANASKNRGMDSNKCAKIIYRGIKKKRSFIVPGFTMKLVYIFNRIIPTKILSRISYRIQSSK